MKGAFGQDLPSALDEVRLTLDVQITPLAQLDERGVAMSATTFELQQSGLLALPRGEVVTLLRQIAEEIEAGRGMSVVE